MKPIGIGLAGARYGARMHLANYAGLPRVPSRSGACARARGRRAVKLAAEANIPFVTE
jgi:predicted dehydrogenase